MKRKTNHLLFLIILLTFNQCAPEKEPLTITKDMHISLIGNNLCSRMMNFGYFETELYLRYPEDDLIIRNMCDGGDTPGFRAHSGRYTPWAFPGAEEFQTDLAHNSGSIGHVEYPDEWLTRLETDLIIASFGFSESYKGKEGLETYKEELRAFVKHTLSQQYNGTSAPQLALVSPIAFQDLSDKYDLPDGKKENRNLEMYADAIEDIAKEMDILFVDAFTPSENWFSDGVQLTIDGLQLNDTGYQVFAQFLIDKVFGGTKASDDLRASVQEDVLEKNWMWHNDFKVPNGVHVFGRRYDPFGSDNYPAEIIKVREMTSNRDQAIWSTLKGEEFDLKAADEETKILESIETNFTSSKPIRYLYGEESMNQFHMAPGYKIELFASEREFPDLANPSQLSFDNKGRLWVSVMPTYPHYKPGDTKPNDKLLILEDTDNDGKADKQTIFLEGIHIPVGFEFAPEGVYVSQGTNLKLYTDTDGDDMADKVEIIMSGFDDHDTHHVISAFCADPSGAIYMGEGVFLHTNVETAYGTVRATNGGFYRFNPQRRHLERTAQISIPNPWGIAFDEWGQNFFAETSGPDMLWMMPGSIKSKYGFASPKGRNLIEKDHLVRPTSGLEFIHSRHFPDEVQGDFLINNTIGFLGTKMHTITDSGTGYESTHRMDLLTSDDPNFRPVDMEFAPDGSLYLVDWHNVLVGHMQHNARDPWRDHVHGRIYRITYPERPLIEPAKVSEAGISELLDNLKLLEYRTRYRTRRELRERNSEEVLSALSQWIVDLDESDSRYEHHLLEALWVTWGLNQIDEDLLRKLLEADDYRVRTATVKVLRYNGDKISEQTSLLKQAARDENSRVRLEALVAGSWLEEDDATIVLNEAANYPLDDWMDKTHEAALYHSLGVIPEYIKEVEAKKAIEEDAYSKKLTLGKEIFERDGYCSTCHQPDGNGLESSGFPPLADTKWVLGNEERLIKLSLHGLLGPIIVNGKEFPGAVPMTPFGGMLNDEEMAAVLTYVRKSFGNNASEISAEKVQEVRASTSDKNGFYNPTELLKEHPLED